MRKGSHGLWLCIAAAAAGSLIAVPAASADVHKYKTEVTFKWDNSRYGTAGFFGLVESASTRCEAGRPVGLFKKRPGGGSRKMVTTKAHFHPHYKNASYSVSPPNRTFHNGDRLYAKVRREVLNGGDVCRADRSYTLTYPDAPAWVFRGA
jgi:hypothetical protein